jgi:type II secretory pathway pseudopilin PulG
MKTTQLHSKQKGAALVVGLILLVVISVLAISGMSTATTELAMARNDQNYENAFQAAETGLEQALGQGSFNPAGTANVTYVINSNDQVTAQIQPDGQPTIVPDKAFTLGAGSSIMAYHFLATAQAESRRAPGSTTDRDSTATHSQAFYVVGPGQAPIVDTTP